MYIDLADIFIVLGKLFMTREDFLAKGLFRGRLGGSGELCS